MIKKSSFRPAAKAVSLAVAVAAITGVLAAAQPATAQRFDNGSASAFGGDGTRMLAPGMQLHAVNPSLSLSAPASAPLQEQMQDDYATTLMNAQRQLLQQNPAGDSPAERSIGSQLDGYEGPR